MCLSYLTVYICTVQYIKTLNEITVGIAKCQFFKQALSVWNPVRYQTKNLKSSTILLLNILHKFTLLQNV